MASSPASPNPKRRGVRSYVRNKYDKLVRSHSRSPSQQLVEPSSSTVSSVSPPPTTIAGLLAPPPDAQTAQSHHSHPDSQLSTGRPENETETTPMSTRTNTMWAGLRSAFEDLRKVARPFPPLESAISSLIPCLGLLEAAARNGKEYENIASELKNLGESLTQHMKEANSIRMSRCIANVAMGIEEQTKLINQKQNCGAGRRLLEAGADKEDIMRHYHKIESLFRRLQIDANLSTWSIANEHLANTRLEGLVPAKMANHDSKLSMEISRRTCTEGTRTAIISEMNDWSLDLDAPDLYLMSGMAGTGKTTIACSFANRLEERKQLAASFFCTRTSPECRDASRIVPTIAYQLARYSTPFQSALCEVLGEDPDIGTKNIVKQFERLLREPLLRVKDAIPENLVVVIDALDECDDRTAVRLILDLLYRFAPGIPLNFFVTSRPEPEIYSKMIAPSPTSRTILHLHEIEKSLVQADIELYLKEELAPMSPAESDIVQLAMKSGSLFIYAATLARYIRPMRGSVNPHRRLRAVLAIKPDSMSKYAEIDALYAAVIRSAFEQNGLDSEETEDVRATLWTVLCAQEPISVDTLSTLAGIDDTERALSAVQPLRSVVHLSETSGLISTLHASFPDFMFDKERSGPLFCDPSSHNQSLARRCFEVMKAQLRFNICDLESSFVPDEKVNDLESRISKAISTTLSYTCWYWADHLENAANSNDLSDVLYEFLSIRLLFWMEVLSLKHGMIRGLGILVKAKKWLRMASSSFDLARFVEDAYNFMTGYAASPASQFTPHIYISSLALCPRSSLVYQKYQPYTRGLIGLKGRGLDRLETVALAIWAIGSPLRSVSYSSDGSQVAFGCNDGRVGVRNAYDGSPIIGPLKGHNDTVWSVAFSPKEDRFVSSSQDHTIKLWNAQDGTLIGKPFQGHTGGVYSVAFSFDGRSIVSCSADKTVRLWNASDGTPVAGPFVGHTKWVWSVAFSPDGTRVVSGSYDHTIRVWNIRNGTLAFDPLMGHTGIVWSVSFSPDGTRIVSSSADRTIRIWNAQNGLPTLGPLIGHTHEIPSVAFSPDGTYLVSCSRDLTIRIWSSENGNLVAGPLEGHTNVIVSVAYSPDGARIVSGAGDESIRVWNASVNKPILDQHLGNARGTTSIALSCDGAHIVSGSLTSVYIWDSRSTTCLAGPFEGHTSIVRSVALSPDGNRLVSGSDDRTIRIWDTNKGTLLAGPFKDHSGAVESVAFSPDGTCIASGSQDCTICVRNSSDGALLAPPFKGHSGVVQSIAFSLNGAYIVSGSNDRTIRLWDTHNGVLAASPFRGHSNCVMSVAFSPCSQYVASGSDDHTARVWNAQKGTLIADPFTGHTDTVRSVAFSPNGELVVSGSADRTVRVWQTHSGRLIAGPFLGHVDDAMSVAFFPDGTRIVSGSWDCTIRMWDLSDVQGVPSTSEHSTALTLNPACPTASSKDWVVKNDGWILDHYGKMLFWASSEVIRCLLTPHCYSIISNFGMVEVDIGSALFGERWQECYVRDVWLLG
ncbi:hypothetical protein CTheo_8041 [Ceratobasidium theobromae]|uniref:NACHT domain-containing protein n=1 Tax=Ceratobasidium theobromae TaxID=1582974 RepID=A0A5N5QAV1_9AGAM|nr:hypothetical protein CTheo_8041 [Ceratobasidium theobromae]